MTQSRKLFQRAASKIPGGVNSPVRAWKAVGGTPLFISRGQGSYIFDAEGRRYIDFVGSWGPLILGHAHPKIVEVVRQQAGSGVTFGAPTMFEIELAETVERLVPSIEKLRLVSSGTEATMSAIRLARAYTGRTKIVKFDGCYHGHSDGLLVKAGSGVATLGLPDSPGVPAGFARETLTSKYNDLKLLQKIFDRHGKNIAAVIIEPICGNMGVIQPELGFLSAIREITQKSNSLLIFVLLGKLIQRKNSIQQMSGPIGIMRYSGQAARMGMPSLLKFMALISLNLAIFNLLPIPILDGGLMLMLLVEAVMRRDIKQEVKERVYQAAFVFLVLFAAVVIFNDVAKTLPGWSHLK